MRPPVCVGVLLGYDGKGANNWPSLNTAETAAPPSFAQQSNFKVPMVLEKKLRVGFAGRRKKISVARESSLEKERGESLFSVLIKHRLIQNDIGVHFTGDGSLTLESLKVGKRKILGE